MVKACFTGCGPVHHLCEFLCFINDMQVPKLNADDQEEKGSQCDV